MLRVDRVADEHGDAKACGLLDERDDGFLDEGSEGRRAHRRQRREKKTVCEPSTVARLLPVLIVIVDRMIVARHAREEEEVGVGQGP